MIRMFFALAWLTLALTANASDYSIIDDYVLNNKKLTQLPSGTSIAIVKDQKIVYEGYFGYSDIENKKAVGRDTVFYIASMTKPFYALYMLIKEQQGKIDIQTTLDELFPDIDFKPDLNANEITVQHLLSHSSGIENWPLIQSTAYTGLYNNGVLAKILQQSKANEKAPLGSYEYTNVGYNILSYWSDSSSNSIWQAGLKEEIFNPLGMTHTSAKMSDIVKNSWDYAQGYSVKSAIPKQPVYLQKTDQTMHAAGGMVSTAKDLAYFLIAQLNQGKVNGKQVLAKSAIKKSHEKLIDYIERGRDRAYGWGWVIRELFNEKLLEHRGGFFGASTYMSFMPDQNIGIVVLSNQDKWGGDLAYAIEDIGYAIALGKADDEVRKLYANNEAFAKKNITKFYENKQEIKPMSLAKVSAVHEGSFVHDTLGKITVSNRGVIGHKIYWGAMSSKIYVGKTLNEYSVMFNPNVYEPISFSNDGYNKTSLRYRNYIFTKE